MKLFGPLELRDGNSYTLSILLMYCLNVVPRPVGNDSSEKTDGIENESVELEKSNILLMGPTGSGNLYNCPLRFLRSKMW